MSWNTIDHENVIIIAIELSRSAWLIAARLPGVEKARLNKIDAGDTAALLSYLSSLQTRVLARTGAAPAPYCCFEAGRDGFWLHRFLATHGIANHVLEPTSILVNRRARRAKTDRLDAEGMLRVLAAYLHGDRQACSMVRVPTPDEETPNAFTASASTWCKRSYASRTASRHCCSRRESTEGRLCAHGSAILLRSGPATAESSRTIFGPSWIAYVAGSS